MSDKTSDKTSDKRLLPCPFCGGKLKRNFAGLFEHDRTPCILCGFEISGSQIEEWNTRKPIEKIMGEFAERVIMHSNFESACAANWNMYAASEERGIRKGLIDAVGIIKKELQSI